MTKCNRCNIEIPDYFAHSLEQNECPACGNKLLTTEQMKQRQLVMTSLSEVQFVDDTDFDSKIKSKIASYLLSRFTFLPKQGRELISAPKQNTQVDTQQTDEIEVSESRPVQPQPIPTNERMEDKVERLKQQAQQMSVDENAAKEHNAPKPITRLSG